MKAFFALLRKDFALLLRDRPGLATLFLMPLLLLVVIALVQDAALSALRGSGASVLIVYPSKEAEASGLSRRLTRQATFRVDTQVAPKVSPERLGALARQGGYSAAVLVPDGLGASIQALLSATDPVPADRPELALWMDPGVPLSLRNGLLAELARCVAMEECAQVLNEVARARAASAGPLDSAPAPIHPVVRMASDGYGTLFVKIEDRTERHGGIDRTPTVTQQNVPAWAVFGMFFIVIPLSSHLISERRNGTLQRLMLAPAWRGTFLVSKVAAYTVTGAAQLLVLLAAGVFLLPQFGLPRLEVHSAAGLTVLAGLISGMAAASFGLLVGLTARSQQQASTVGAITVVIAAALGGIMVPLFAMPPYLRVIGDASPLSWALTLFLKLFLQPCGWSDVLRESLLLLAFSGACLGLSLVCLHLRVSGERVFRWRRTQRAEVIPAAALPGSSGCG